MAKRETVLTPGQFKDLATALLQAIPTDMDPQVAQDWIENKGDLGSGLRALLMPPVLHVGRDELLAPWQAFYREAFGIELDCAKIVIPPKRRGFDRLLVIAPGLTAEQLFRKCRELFPSWKYTDADLDVISDRTARDGAYAIWVRDVVEADNQHKNQSAHEIKRSGVIGITLEERLVYELKYFKETGKHLDPQNVTLCAGSRFRSGGVPSVGWSSGGVSVYDFRTGYYDNDYLRAREVVSIKKATQLCAAS